MTFPIVAVDGHILEKDSDEPEPALAKKAEKRTRRDTQAFISPQRAGWPIRSVPDSDDFVISLYGDVGSSKRKRSNPKSK
jgi:hypothetical protein